MRAFVWRDGAMTDLGTLGRSSSQAIEINERGHIIGNSDTLSGSTHAVLWRRAGE
jgi:probable HAF family extracellular repeat protein